MWNKLLKLFSEKEKNSSESTSIFSSNKSKILLITLSSVTPLIIITVIVVIIMLPLLLVKQFLADASSEDPSLFKKINETLALNDWCTENDKNCNKNGVQKYYERINKVNEDYKEKGIELDIQLLTATIFYSNTQRADLFINDEEEDEIQEGNIKLSDINKLASNMISGGRVDYTKYKKYLIDTYIPKRFKDLYEGKQDTKTSIENIADEIMSFASETNPNLATNQYYGSCSYNVSGNTVNASNIQVVLVTCDGSRELERVDFETYIKGVVYGEIGSTWPEEVLKAQAVAARSYTLTRNQTLCPGRPNNCEYGYNPQKNEIRMRNCEGDQVYCDYKQGCQSYNYNGYNSLVSGTKNPTLKEYKPALSAEDAEKFENILNKVNGQTLINEDNTIYASAFINTDQNMWNSMYNANNSLDYNDILVKHYWNKTNSNVTISSNCTNYGSSGEFSQWKQFDPRWANTNLGYSNMHSVGCLVTSISIQFQRSGTVNLSEFNPGIFADELTKRGSFSPGGALAWDPLKQTIRELSNDKFRAVNLDYALYGTKQEKINTLTQLSNSGNLLVLGVKYEGHWVAVDRIENDKVYIFDPGDSYVTEVTQKYDWGGVTKVQIYNIVQ